MHWEKKQKYKTPRELTKKTTISEETEKSLNEEIKKVQTTIHTLFHTHIQNGVRMSFLKLKVRKLTSRITDFPERIYVRFDGGRSKLS